MKRFAIEVIIISTIKDVARYTGLSIATISKYINGGNVREENRKKIDEAINVLNYKINEMARGLKTNRTMTIGILIPSLENIFFTSIVSNIENILHRHGYSTIICDYHEDEQLEKEKLSFLLNKMVDGIILVPGSEEGDYLEKVLPANTPVVLIDRMLKGVKCDVVLADNLNASYEAVEHLIIRGHRNISIILGPENIYTARERLKGYYRAHEDYSLQTNHRFIKFGDYTIESGYKLLMDILDTNPEVTAVFVTNYEMTLGAIMAINEKNITVPDRISLIGFDNMQMAKIVKPPLSIVVQPMREIGEKVANVLLDRLRGNKASFPSVYRLKTEIIMKESVGRIK